MAKDPSEIVIGANGSIYTAPLGSTVPANITVPLGGDWSELGYASEDGVTWVDGKSLESVRAWQSFYDLRRIVSSKEGSLAFQLMQWGGEQVKLAFGGGAVTEPTPNAYRYTPPDPQDIDERMLCVEWEDGDNDFRLTFPKGMVTDNVEVNIVRTSAALLPITFGLLGDEALDPFILDTNHPAFASAVGS